MQPFLDKCMDLIATFGGKILVAILVWIVGSFVIKALGRAAEKAISKTKLDETAKRVVLNIIRALLYVILVISIIQVLGVPMSSVKIGRAHV